MASLSEEKSRIGGKEVGILLLKNGRKLLILFAIRAESIYNLSQHRFY